MKFTETELRLIILNNPNIKINILKDSYPRADQQVTLLENGIRIDFGYGCFKEDKDSLYYKLGEYGVTWEFQKEKQILEGLR